MSHQVITIDANGNANPDQQPISMKDADTVDWQSADGKEWMVVFRGNCPFTDRDFHVPAKLRSRVAQQCSGLQKGEHYIYTVAPWPPIGAGGSGGGGADPVIIIIP